MAKAPTFQALFKDIENQKFSPIYTLVGEEVYFIDKIEAAIRKYALKPEERDFNQTVFYGKDTDVNTVIDACQRYPMMAERQLVILREAQDLYQFSSLESYVKQLNPQTVFVICYKYKKPDGRASFTKLLKSSGIYFEAKKIYENQVPKWIQEYLAEKNIQIDSKEAFLMTQYLGANLSKIANECDKLILNLKENEKVTSDHIQKYIGISKNYNIFELQDALTQRNVVKLVQIGQYFQDNPKAHPMPMVVGSLYAFFSKVYALKGMKGKSPAEQMKNIGVGSSFIFKNYQNAANVYSQAALENTIEILYQYDRKSKGINSGTESAEKYLLEMILSIYKCIESPIQVIA